MPRLAIDYSKSIIYKICCKDPTITDIYIGHTTDLTRRRQRHKNNCNNEKKTEYNYKVYQFIRENGDWDNWSVIPIEEYPCENIIQASIRERYWLEELKATLNKNIPSRTDKEYYKDNKEKFKEKSKDYYQNNQEYIKEYNKEYYNNHKEKKKEYYENNKKKINEKRSEKINCECGGKYTHNNKSIHFNSQKHQNFHSFLIKENKNK